MVREKGLATLSVVSGIVMIGALFSFAVMQLGMNETKKTQNLVVKGIQKANARASIDCAVAVFENLTDVDPSSLNINEFNDCKIGEGTTFTLVPEDTNWILTASHGFANSAVLIGARSGSFAVFKTAGNIEIKGGQNWLVATGDKIAAEGDNVVECTAIIAGGSVTIDVEYTNAIFETYAPGNLSCGENYSTEIPKGSGKVTEGFELDILENQLGIDIFADLFGVTKDKWPEIKSQFDTVITTGSAVSASTKAAVTQCGASIKAAIKAGHDLIWVEGDCLLNGMTDTTYEDRSPLIVVKNGIMGLTETLDRFKGSFLQFTVDYPNSNLANSWGPKSFGVCAPGAMNTLCGQLINVWGYDSPKWATLPFYIYGAFITKGAFLIDIPDTTVYVDGSFIFSYDDGLEDNSIIKVSPKVLKGSYHDF